MGKSEEIGKHIVASRIRTGRMLHGQHDQGFFGRQSSSFVPKYSIADALSHCMTNVPNQAPLVIGPIFIVWQKQ
jgi:hypothetical protein